LQRNKVCKLVFHTYSDACSGLEFGMVGIFTNIAAQVQTGFYLKGDLGESDSAA